MPLSCPYIPCHDCKCIKQYITSIWLYVNDFNRIAENFGELVILAFLFLDGIDEIKFGKLNINILNYCNSQ